MKIRIAILGFVLLLAVPLLAREKVDVLVMKNGDRMTCEVKGLDTGVLYVSFDYIDGTSSVDWSKVARLESQQLFVVKTEDGSVYTGKLGTPETPAGRPVQIHVIENSHQPIVLNRSQIVQMFGTSDRFWQRFNGEISFGTTYTKGNQSSQYNLGSQANYVRERWTVGATYDSSFSSSSGTSASTRNSLTMSGLHLLPQKNWFYSGVGDFLQSSEQGISLQTTVGGGVGRFLKNSNRSSVSLLGGAAWQNTRYQQSDSTSSSQNLAAALIYSEVRFFRFSKSNLVATAALLPALSQPGRVRFATDATYYLKIISDLKWNVSFYGNWDNRPPPGFSSSDYGTSSGLSWTFGLK